MQMLNGLWKDKRLDELDEFFKIAVLDDKTEHAVEKEGTDQEDTQFFSKDIREKFAEYLDETLPKTEYFNQFFQQAFDVINEAFDGVEGAWLEIRMANIDVADSNLALASSIT